MDITFENAVVDKKTLFLSFTVKSDKKIKESELWDRAGRFKINVNNEVYDPLLFKMTNKDGTQLKESTGRSTTSGCEDYVDGRNDYAMKFISTENMKSLKLVPSLKGKRYEDKEVVVDLFS